MMNDELLGRRGVLLVISGPSGVGKDTLVQRFREINPEIRRKISYTTRAPRSGEVDGRDYFFVDNPTFERMEAQGEFLETARYNGNGYGTSKAQVQAALEGGHTMSLIVDVQGAALLKPIFPDAAYIFVMPPSMEELERRLRGRQTESSVTLEARLLAAQKELEEASWYDYQVVNDSVEAAASEILEIARTHHAPRPRSLDSF